MRDRRGHVTTTTVQQSGRRCLCAVITCCALVGPPLAADPPRYLQPPQREPGNPFDAALRDDLPPPQHGSYHFLGRGSRTNGKDTVVFADEQQPSDPADEATESAEGAGSLWGHAAIEQTQYPLDEPPAAAAPDEPRWIAPLLRPPDQVVDRSDRWVSVSQVPIDVTSVLGSGDDLGWTTVTARMVIESPGLQGFSVRPVFGWHLIGEPDSTDLPSQVYDLSVELRMYWPFGERWLGEFAVAPGFFSDFDNTSSDAVRIVGRGIGYYTWSETFRLAIGIAYLDRQDIALLPLGGVIWTPNPDWRYEIMLPRPRVAHRFWSDDRDERWVYLVGEFGGGSWAIQRAGGMADVATYRDYRLILGLEFQYESGCAWRLEAGYAFGRQLEYESTIGDFEPDGAGLVRAALTF